MKPELALTAALAVLLSAIAAQGAAPVRAQGRPVACAPSEDARAGALLRRARSLREIAAIADRHAACAQSGDLASDISDRVAWTFARRWRPTLAAIAAERRERTAALRLIVYISDRNDEPILAAIRDNALRRCPRREEDLCQRLLDQVPGVDAFHPRT